MKGFTEAWLRDYQAKRAGIKQPVPMVRARVAKVAAAIAAPPPLPEGAITFTLSRPTVTLNEYLRMYWTKRSEYQRQLSDAIGRQVLAVPPAPPLQRAVLTVTRYSLERPDDDGLVGGLKPLIDCLLVKSDRHPHGLGFIVDDAPDNLVRISTSVRCATRKEQRTVVVIAPAGPEDP